MRVMPILRGLVLLSVAFAFLALGRFLWLLPAQTKQTSDAVGSAMTQLAKDVSTTTTQLTKDVDDIKVMANATLYQAEEVLHHTDVLVATETKAQVSQLAKVNESLDQLSQTIKNLDATQVSVGHDVHETMIALPPAIKQAQDALEATQKAIIEAQKTLNITSQDLTKLQPAIDNIDKTTEHINSMSASLDEVIKNATKPKPWYSKVFGYMWAPIKIAATLSPKP